MNIVVFSSDDIADTHIYKNVEILGLCNGNCFRILDETSHETIAEYCYNDYMCREIKPEEEIAFAVGTGEGTNIGLTHTDCERLILVGSKVGDLAEISPEQLSEFDWININGNKFRREE